MSEWQVVLDMSLGYCANTLVCGLRNSPTSQITDRFSYSGKNCIHMVQSKHNAQSSQKSQMEMHTLTHTQQLSSKEIVQEIRLCSSSQGKSMSYQITPEVL